GLAPADTVNHADDDTRDVEGHLNLLNIGRSVRLPFADSRENAQRASHGVPPHPSVAAGISYYTVLQRTVSFQTRDYSLKFATVKLFLGGAGRRHARARPSRAW